MQAGLQKNGLDYAEEKMKEAYKKLGLDYVKDTGVKGRKSNEGCKNGSSAKKSNIIKKRANKDTNHTKPITIYKNPITKDANKVLKPEEVKQAEDNEKEKWDVYVAARKECEALGRYGMKISNQICTKQSTFDMCWNKYKDPKLDGQKK